MAKLYRSKWQPPLLKRRRWIGTVVSTLSGPVGTATETDTALALSAVQIGATGTATETDSALALASGASGAVGTATETDTALALAGVQIKAVGTATETDTALALTGASGTAPGVATETDTAFALAAVQKLLVGVALEVDTALALSAGGGLSDAEFRDLYNWINELRLVHGLVSGSPMTVNQTTRVAGAVSQTISTVGSDVTVTRV